MRVRADYVRQNDTTEGGTPYPPDDQASQQFAFSNRVEAMAAHGIVGSLLERELADGARDFTQNPDRFKPFSAPQAVDLQEAIRERYQLFRGLQLGGQPDSFLPVEQSEQLLAALDWVAGASYRRDIMLSRSSFGAIAAGGIALKHTITTAQELNIASGTEILARISRGGLRSWILPRRTRGLVDYIRSTDEQHRPLVTVTTEHVSLSE